MLAQMDQVRPEYLQQFVYLLLGVLGGGAAVATILGVFRKQDRQIQPQPLVVAGAPQYVQEAECTARHGQAWEAIRALQRQREEDLKAAAHSRKGLYEALHVIASKDLPEMERRLDEKNEARVSEVHKRINELPDRVIATLRNTGVIQ